MIMRKAKRREGGWQQQNEEFVVRMSVCESANVTNILSNIASRTVRWQGGAPGRNENKDNEDKIA